jgi:hypothetical protein
MRISFIPSLLTCLILPAFLSGCGLFGSSAKVDTPAPNNQLALYESRGSLFGSDDSGFSLGGNKNKDGGGGGGGAGIGVNSFLWRATLDTLGFMPLASADPFGGVIITDWYEDPKAKGERYKVNVLILDKSLRADGVKVTLFKQKIDDDGVWRDEAVNPGVGHDLEDTILTRARELRIAQLGK